MFLVGHRPAGHFQTFNANGKYVEGESRQCIHCQYTWEYHSGSNDERGYCTRHNGFVCARPECARRQLKWITEMKSPYSCASFYDYNRWRFEQYLLDPRYTVRPSGIIVPIELT